MTSYTAHSKQGSKTLRTLLNDAARYPKGPHWPNLQAFHAQMGDRPENAALLKRNTRTAHGPGNSYWSTNGDKASDKASRASQKQKKVPDQHPQTKKALRAFLVASKPRPQPPYKPRTRTQAEQDQQVALLLAALRGPNYESLS